MAQQTTPGGFVLTWRDGVLALTIVTGLLSAGLSVAFLFKPAPAGVATFGLLTIIAAAVIHALTR